MPAHATELLTNGDFETGDFTGWTASTEASSQGSLSIVPNNGGTSPFSGDPYALNGTGGNFFAISDQTGPGSYSLTQSFTADGSSDITVSFQLFANSDAGVAVTDPDRDFNTTPNQNAEVDILTGGADPFTTSAGDIVATLYGPGADAGANPNPWTDYTDDLGVLAAGTYQIRFAETDNQLFFQMGVDNVSVQANGVPEPASLALLGAGISGLGLVRRRKKG